MAKKWMPQVGESYIVRSSDAGKTGCYFGVVYVKRVVGVPRTYTTTKLMTCAVEGPFLDEKGKFTENTTWQVGKAGLIKDLPFV